MACPVWTSFGASCNVEARFVDKQEANNNLGDMSIKEIQTVTDKIAEAKSAMTDAIHNFCAKLTVKGKKAWYPNLQSWIRAT